MVFTKRFSGSSLRPATLKTGMIVSAVPVHVCLAPAPHTQKKKEKERKKNSVHHLPHFNTILGRGITGCISKCTHIMWWCSTYTRALRIPDELNHGCKWKRHGTQEADAVVAWNHGCYHKCPLMRGWVQKPNNAFEEIFHAYADLDTMVV